MVGHTPPDARKDHAADDEKGAETTWQAAAVFVKAAAATMLLVTSMLAVSILRAPVYASRRSLFDSMSFAARRITELHVLKA
jgi:hypothetical protein